MKIFTTFEESKLLKSGNTRLTTTDGRTFYVLADAPVEIKLKEAVEIVYRTEKKGEKDVLIVEAAKVSDTPSLPKTTVTATVAPGGETPVQPAKKKDAAKASYGGDFQKPWLPEEAHRVAVLNILQATLTSPAVGQQNLGRNDEELIATIRKVFKAGVTMYEEAVQPVK